jgi:pyruvate dehydrogenase E2 component (dihydrolipoamide acetyltransferase)
VIDVIVPQVGEAIAEVTLVRWLKQVGDHVSKDEPLFEVDTEKATFEVEAFADGTLAEILVPDGSSVNPLQVVAKLAPCGAEETVTPASTGPLPTQAADPETSADIDSLGGDAQREGRLVSRRARRIAEERGIDLAALSGTGAQGMISVEDVERAAEARPGAASTHSAASKDRKHIARRVQTSKRNVPHFYLQAEIEMTAVGRLRAQAGTRSKATPSVTAVIVKACALLLSTDPSLNVHWDGEEVVANKTIAIGVAVDTERGLQVVTISGDAHSVDETAVRLRGAVERARSGRLRPEDAATKSLVVSNLGMYGVDAFFAIIDEPDAMILSVGQTVDKMVIADGKPDTRPIATFGLAIDHRALDGVDGARFLGRLRKLLDSADVLRLDNGSSS